MGPIRDGKIPSNPPGWPPHALQQEEYLWTRIQARFDDLSLAADGISRRISREIHDRVDIERKLRSELRNSIRIVTIFRNWNQVFPDIEYKPEDTQEGKQAIFYAKEQAMFKNGKYQRLSEQWRPHVYAMEDTSSQLYELADRLELVPLWAVTQNDGTAGPAIKNPDVKGVARNRKITPAPKPADETTVSHVELDALRSRVRIDKRWYELKGEECDMLAILFKANGVWVCGKDFKSRPDKTKKTMLKAVAKIIQTSKQGYRLNPDLLT
jgi:hypothetical protein